VGARVATAGQSHQARVQLEMGGKNPLVVLDDCDLERAVSARSMVHSSPRASDARIEPHHRDAGRSTICSWPRWLRRSRPCALAMRFLQTRQMGRSQVKRSWKPLSNTRIATKEGDAASTGGERLSLDQARLLRVARAHRRHKARHARELRRSVRALAATVRVRDYDEALAVANSGEFGHSAGICTTSLKYARHFTRNVRAGHGHDELTDRTAWTITCRSEAHGSPATGGARTGVAAVEFYTQIKNQYSWA